MKNEDIEDYVLGLKLYGDDFALNEIEKWYLEEKEAYANLGAKNKSKYQYVYHQINKVLGYKFLGKEIRTCLGLGSAYGDELAPIIDKIGKIKIIEPSSQFNKTKEIKGIPCEYFEPRVDGSMPFENNYFDLITCFSALHHIPNVSHVIKECYRVLSNNGVMLIREPIVSMGDWREKRMGLTKNERGIPLNIFHQIISESGFRISHQTLWNFTLLPNLLNKLGIIPYNNYVICKLDIFLCALFRWNYRYHARKTFHKLRPTSIFYFLEKSIS
ncbi:MAG TPA: class I SAM-dependent methyltransferase [Smithellaceae bacterium]|nr:class I SAM-dependent methyltransferase [Smithellaceae bacterium]